MILFVGASKAFALHKGYTLASKRQRVASLLKRFQFIDLSQAVSCTGDVRTKFLREYIGREGGIYATYEPFRKAVGGIYGVTLGLDPSPAGDWPKIEEAIRRHCKGKDEGMNLSAAQALFDMVREDAFAAYSHPERSLRLGLDRASSIRIEHYLVRGDELIFQFPYPRRTRLSDYELRVMASLMHYGYAIGDFAEAAIEIADLSAAEGRIKLDGRWESGPRTPRIIAFPRSEIIARTDLEAEIQDVYRILMLIADEPE